MKGDETNDLAALIESAQGENGIEVEDQDQAEDAVEEEEEDN